MQNKKVYLAKSIFAKGLDVEYVKSNLLRVPGIEIIQSASGMSVRDCACVIIVSGNPKSELEAETFTTEKNIVELVEEFVNSEDILTNSVMVYSGKGKSNCEDKSAPNCFICADYNLDLNTLDVSAEKVCLLSHVSNLVGVNTSEWKQNSRHYKPKKEFEVPVPIPLNVRRSKAIIRIPSDNSEQKSNSSITYEQKKAYTKPLSESSSRLRKKRRL